MFLKCMYKQQHKRRHNHALTDTSRFLLVSLNIDAILQETTIHLRRQKLNSMTDGLGLDDAYGATLDRIKRQGNEKARLGMATLMWISHSERPLKPGELCNVLAVEIGSPSLNTDNVPSLETLLACCQGLIAVNKEASTLQLIHATLQKYLQAHPELFGTAHERMAEACLSYLDSQQVNALSTTLSDLEETPFLEYSSLYWGMHAKRGLSDSAKHLALKLLEDCPSHISTKILLEALAQKPYSRAVDFNNLSLFSGLHCASIFGIADIVASLVEIESCDINQKDCAGNTPLMWAAWNGHEGVAEILLGRQDINPNKPDNRGQTPLYCAAWTGHEGVVKMLLGHDDVNPDKPDVYGQTPLFGAASNGHERVVEVLLRRDDVNPDKPNNNGQTPLFGAAWDGHEGVVRMLLEHGGVSPDKPDKLGRTPLWWAVKSGHAGAVALLQPLASIISNASQGRGPT